MAEQKQLHIIANDQLILAGYLEKHETNRFQLSRFPLLQRGQDLVITLQKLQTGEDIKNIKNADIPVEKLFDPQWLGITDPDMQVTSVSLTGDKRRIVFNSEYHLIPDPQRRMQRYFFYDSPKIIMQPRLTLGEPVLYTEIIHYNEYPYQSVIFYDTGGLILPNVPRVNKSDTMTWQLGRLQQIRVLLHRSQNNQRRT